MATRVALHHTTRYAYDRSVVLSPQLIRLRPAPHTRTPILSYALQIEPYEHALFWQQDPFGNFVGRAVFPEPTAGLQVDVDLVVELRVQNPFDFFLEPDAEHWPFAYAPTLAKELAPCRETTAAGPRLHAFLSGLRRERTLTVDFLVELNRVAHRSVAYVIRADPGVQTPEETLEKGSGSCRDSAWLLVQALRYLGFAARFASGYLIQLAAHDFADLHAWAEVYLPGAGWIGLDATSGLLTGEGHIPLACAPEPTSAAPITGSLEKCEVDFSFALSVSRVERRASGGACYPPTG